VTAPGELRHRLVLEAPVETPDGAGGVSRSYATLAAVWAKVTPVAARSEVVADDPGATVTHQIVVRKRSDMTTQHRFRLGARVYRIVALRDQDASGRFTEIAAQERVD
jgi:SPP1 family predicted phage head-tail adaptor